MCAGCRDAYACVEQLLSTSVGWTLVHAPCCWWHCSPNHFPSSSWIQHHLQFFRIIIINSSYVYAFSCDMPTSLWLSGMRWWRSTMIILERFVFPMALLVDWGWLAWTSLMTRWTSWSWRRRVDHDAALILIHSHLPSHHAWPARRVLFSIPSHY